MKKIETGIAAIHDILSDRLTQARQYGKGNDWSLADLEKAYKMLSEERPSVDVVLQCLRWGMEFLDTEYPEDSPEHAVISGFLQKFHKAIAQEFLDKKGTRADGLILQQGLMEGQHP